MEEDTAQQTKPGIQAFLPDSIPDHYVDSVMSILTPYGLVLYLMRQEFDLATIQRTNQVLAKVRMSHAQTWTLVQKLNGLLDQYMRDTGPIALPEQIVEELGLQDEYREMQEEYGRHGS